MLRQAGLAFDASAPLRRAISRIGALSCAAFILTAGCTWALQAWAADPMQVTQKNRAFQPKEVEIGRGDTLRFVNDDGYLLHHVYSKSDAFSFDTGEQPPGTAINVRFPAAGSYTVLCGIHPRMRLVVSVR